MRGNMATRFLARTVSIDDRVSRDDTIRERQLQHDAALRPISLVANGRDASGVTGDDDAALGKGDRFVGRGESDNATSLECHNPLGGGCIVQSRINVIIRIEEDDSPCGAVTYGLDFRADSARLCRDREGRLDCPALDC